MTVRLMNYPNAEVRLGRGGLYLRGLGDVGDGSDVSCCDDTVSDVAQTYDTTDVPVDTTLTAPDDTVSDVAQTYDTTDVPVDATLTPPDTSLMDLILPTQTATSLDASSVDLTSPSEGDVQILENMGYAVDPSTGNITDSTGAVVGILEPDGSINTDFVVTQDVNLPTTLTPAEASAINSGITSSLQVPPSAQQIPSGSGVPSSGSSGGSSAKPSSGGTGSAAIAVPVLQASASPNAIAVGGSSTLSWSAQNASAVTINGQVYPTSGSLSIKPSQSTTYQFVAYNSAGQQIAANVLVSVGATAATAAAAAAAVAAAPGSSWLTQSSLVSGMTNEKALGIGVAVIAGIAIIGAMVKR